MVYDCRIHPMSCVNSPAEALNYSYYDYDLLRPFECYNAPLAAMLKPPTKNL